MAQVKPLISLTKSASENRVLTGEVADPWEAQFEFGKGGCGPPQPSTVNALSHARRGVFRFWLPRCIAPKWREFSMENCVETLTRFSWEKVDALDQ